MTRPRYTLLREHARARSAEVGAACVLVVGLVAWPYTVDDAFIVARYACNLSAGLGYGMNPGVPSDGVTGPLWLWPEVIARRSGADPIAIAKVVGLGCAVLATWLLLRGLRGRALGHCASWAAATLLACSPSLGTWAVAGLETGVATLLVTLAALGATRRPSPRGWTVGSCIALLAWLRPEIALLCAVLLVHLARRERRAATLALGLALLGAASVIAFRWWCFGDPVPLSVRAKLGSLGHGLHYTLQAIALSTSLFGVWLAAGGARKGGRHGRALGIAVLSQLVAVVLVGGDWMPGYRLLVPVLPLYALLAGRGIAGYWLRRPWLGAVLLALCCVVPVLDLVTRTPELRATLASRERSAVLAAFLRTHARRVALVDVGYIGYASGLEVVDLGGLTDARIAAMPGGHLSKRVDAGYLQARDPDAIVLHSATPPEVDGDRRLRGLQGFAVERRVAAMRFVRDRYVVDHVVGYAPRYYYAVLTRSSYGLPR